MGSGHPHALRGTACRLKIVAVLIHSEPDSLHSVDMGSTLSAMGILALKSPALGVILVASVTSVASLGWLSGCSSSNNGAGSPADSALGGQPLGLGGAQLGGTLNNGGNTSAGGTPSGLGGAVTGGSASLGGFGAGTGGGSNSGGSSALGGSSSGGSNSGGSSALGGGSGAENIGGGSGAAGAAGAGGSAPVMCSPENSTCQITGTCCGGECVELARASNIRHCGSCGNACSATDFCASVAGQPSIACLGATLKNLCANAAVAGVTNGFTVDDAASSVLVAALHTGCAPQPVNRMVQQGATNVVDSVTGKPLIGPGELLVAAGGDSTNTLVRYLNNLRITPIYNEGFNFRRSKDQSLVQAVSNLTANHDYLVIQAVRDPATGTLVLVAYGWDQAGTTAAAWFFANVMMPTLSSYTDTWYVYEWTDQGADSMPGSAAEFRLIQSGN